MHLVTPRCVVSRPDPARAARRPCIVSWLRPCRRPLPQGAGRPGPAGSAGLGESDVWSGVGRVEYIWLRHHASCAETGEWGRRKLLEIAHEAEIDALKSKLDELLLHVQGCTCKGSGGSIDKCGVDMGSVADSSVMGAGDVLLPPNRLRPSFFAIFF